ncbi:MAG: FtsX-like permease family protein [Archangium sp.]|nr:FtsX-like permease family protein [Archangium sp.]MDP3151476.1 FtsX-like permease family protein [Archangium sp.]MDP3575368.1 FtsX-like permease family protein [Archangium sp.]
MLLRLAARNVFRAKARSAITIGALFFGVLMTLLLSAFVMGVGESLVAETIESRVGAIQVHKAGYFEKRDRQPLAFYLEQSPELETKLRSVANVKAFTPRISFNGMLTNGSRGAIAVITAIDPATVQSALPKVDLYLEGKALEQNDRNGAHVGQELNRALDLKPGVPLMLQAQGLGGRDNALDLEPRGVLAGQNPLEGKRAVTVTLAFAQSLLGMDKKVTEYVIAIDDVTRLDETAAAIGSALGPDCEVQTWEQLRPSLRDARLLQRAILGGLAFIFLIIALFGVANTLLMTVLERTREIGTLLAVGMTRSMVARLFVLEALLQAALGALLGLGVALVVLEFARNGGGIMVSMGSGQGYFRMMPTLLPAVPFLVVGSACLGSVLAAVSPALRAARMRPVEALSSP